MTFAPNQILGRERSGNVGTTAEMGIHSSAKRGVCVRSWGTAKKESSFSQEFFLFLTSPFGDAVLPTETHAPVVLGPSPRGSKRPPASSASITRSLSLSMHRLMLLVSEALFVASYAGMSNDGWGSPSTTATSTAVGGDQKTYG